METAKNTLSQDLPRPVEALNEAQAEAAEGGLLPAVQKCRKAGGDQQEYMQVTMSDVLISSY